MNWEEVFKKAGIVKKGHYILSSDLHTDIYYDFAVPICQTNNSLFIQIVEGLCELVNPRIPPWLTVVGVGKGAFYAREMAIQLQESRGIPIRFAFFTRGENNQLILRYDQECLFKDPEDNKKGAEIIIMDDAHTTGDTLNSMIGLVNQLGASILQYITIVNRAKAHSHAYSDEYSLLIESLIHPLNLNHWPDRKDCPLCLAGEPFSTAFGQGHKEFHLKGQPQK